MVIRTAVPSDLRSIQTLFLELYAFHTAEVLREPIASFVKVTDRQSYAAEIVSHYFSDEYYLFVAVKDQQIVGYICGKVNQRKEYQIHPEGFIEDWYVTASERGVGTGKKLYNELVKKFSALGCQTLALEVFFHNTSAMNLYRSMGFSEDAIYLKKRIDEKATL